MGGPAPAMRDGVAALLGHDAGNAKSVVRIGASSVGGLLVSASTGKKTFTYDANSRISTLAIENEVDGSTVTQTYTFTYNASGLIQEISAAVIS